VSAEAAEGAGSSGRGPEWQGAGPAANAVSSRGGTWAEPGTSAQAAGTQRFRVPHQRGPGM